MTTLADTTLTEDELRVVNRSSGTRSGYAAGGRSDRFSSKRSTATKSCSTASRESSFGRVLGRGARAALGGAWTLFAEHFVRTGTVDRDLAAKAREAERLRYEADHDAADIDREAQPASWPMPKVFVDAISEVIPSEEDDESRK